MPRLRSFRERDSAVETNQSNGNLTHDAKCRVKNDERNDMKNDDDSDVILDDDDSNDDGNDNILASDGEAPEDEASEEEHSDDEAPEEENSDDKAPEEQESDDEAPESMAFSKSKESALQKVKEAMQQIQESKKQRKEKRRQLNEKYMDQKKRRLEALSKARLPDDILAEIPSQPVIKVKPVKDNNKTEGNDSEDELLSNLSDEEEVEINQGFIPLKYDRYGGVSVTTESDILSKTKSLADSALEFRNKSLYGGRIPRISTKEKMLKNQKRKANFMY